VVGVIGAMIGGWIFALLGIVAFGLLVRPYSIVSDELYGFNGERSGGIIGTNRF
jgi:hypothetical protein